MVHLNMRYQNQGYTGLQVGLHWSIAVLIFFQLIFGESMTTFVDHRSAGGQRLEFAPSMASAHYWVGVAILALVTVRIGARLLLGAPDVDPSTPQWMTRASQATHAIFYALLIAVPVSGLLAYYSWNWMGDVHALAKPVFIVLITVHAGAALFHHFVLKDAILRKMIVPGSNPVDR